MENNNMNVNGEFAGTTAAGVVSAFAVGSVASVAAPVAIAVGVGAGVGFLAKKAFDWLLD